MEVLNYSDARSTLAGTMQKVCDNHSPITITRKGAGSVVMMSLEDYQALEETNYLLRSPSNAERLTNSIQELNAGQGTTRELQECE